MDGRLVKVRTKYIDDSGYTEEFWIVGTDNDAEALEIITKELNILPGTIAETVRTITESELKTANVKPGEIKSYS